jgi:voltage-gated potassium channel
MTGRASEPNLQTPHRMIVYAALRAVASAVALVTLYYVVPLDHISAEAAVAILAIGLVALTGLIVFQVRSIMLSRFPGLRAVEAIAVSVPLFLLLFAGTYVVMARFSVSAFTEPLTRTDALYFAVTTFATVGFGDITPRTEAARLVVTGQVVSDLIIVGFGVRVIAGAVRHGRQQRPAA